MQNILKFFLLSILSFNYAYGQTDSLSLLYGDFSENESVYNELILELRENPININSADKNDLMRIPLLTEQMADSILKIRLIKKRFTNRRQIRPATGTDIFPGFHTFPRIRSRVHRISGLLHQTSLRFAECRSC